MLYGQNKYAVLRKTVSLITVISFILTNSAYGAPSSRSLFKNKKVDYEKISTQSEETIQKKKSILQNQDKPQERQKAEAKRVLTSHLKDLSQIHIPSELGRVIEVYEGTSDTGQGTRPLVVHIQDLHTNPEAQYNLASILEILLKDYNLGLVCSEGADGIVDTSSVSSFPDYQVREKTAKIFVNTGELTAEEYLSITKYPDLPIWGVEDRDIYFKNIIEFNKIMKFAPSSQNFISQAQKALTGFKDKIYSKELLALDQKETDYESHKIETEEYLKYLASYIQKFNIPTSKYRNISILIESMEQEKTIDQIKVMQESQNLLLNLQAGLTGKSSARSDLDGLMAKAGLFKDQKISPFSFYSYLKDLSLKYLPDQTLKYQNLNNFVDYLTKVNSLDSTKLFVEMEDLTYEIKQYLARTQEEKNLAQAFRNIKFLEGFFNLKVSNEELDYYLANRDTHKVGWFKTIITGLTGKTGSTPRQGSGQAGQTNYIDYNPDLIDGHLQELEDFYKTVKDRDIAMVKNAISEIENRSVKVAALISGGFHTKGITRLLKEKGYSYIVVSPYSSTDIDEENYHYLLSGQRKPIEELFKQMDLSEIVKRLSAGLRVPLGFDNDLMLALAKEVVPELKKIREGADLDQVKESVVTRISAILATQRNAANWQTDQDIEIRFAEEDTVFVKCNDLYLRVTPRIVERINSSGFRGKALARITPAGEVKIDTDSEGENLASGMTVAELLKEATPRIAAMTGMPESAVDIGQKIEQIIDAAGQGFGIGDKKASILTWGRSPFSEIVFARAQGGGLVIRITSRQDRGRRVYFAIKKRGGNFSLFKVGENDFRGSTKVTEVTPQGIVKVARLPNDRNLASNSGLDLDAIKQVIAGNEFLRAHTPADLIRRIETDRDKQRLALNGLGMLVTHYNWVFSDYVNRPEVTAEERAKIIIEVQNDIYKPMITSLRIIARRLESGNLVPNAVRLKLSDKDQTVPEVRISRRANVSLLSMKGDPWQVGHIWSILRVLADGADRVIIMLDNSDPERKPQLTALPIREADSEWLFDAFSPFVAYTRFQRDRGPLLTADGETILPTLIHENSAIIDFVNWQYIAGYDHFKWVTSNETGLLLDTPHKLLFDMMKFLRAGSPAHISARFNRREADSKDSASDVKDRIKVIEALAQAGIIDFYAGLAVSLAKEEMPDAIEAINKWRQEMRREVIETLSGNQKIKFEQWEEEGKEALDERGTDNPSVKVWLERFKSATAWLGSDAFAALHRLLAENNVGGLTSALRSYVLNAKMSFAVVEQPMDTSSTDVRTHGKLHTVPLPIAHSIIGLQRYPAFTGQEVWVKDKAIASEAIAFLIDLGQIKIKSGKVVKRSLVRHLGPNLTSAIDIDILVNKLNERLAKRDKRSGIFDYSGIEGVATVLKNAHANALHAIDGYLIKFLLRPDMREILFTRGRIAKNRDIEFINSIREILIGERAAQIVAESRQMRLAEKADGGALASNEALVESVKRLERVEGGIIAGVGLKDNLGRELKPDGRFFTPEGEFTEDLETFMDSLSDEKVRENIHAGIMYYDIRSEFWRKNPEFVVAFALAFAKKLQEKHNRKDGIVLNVGLDAYEKHFEPARLFIDTILRTGICDNGGGIIYWGSINGGDSRNYAQLYHAMNNGKGGDWVYFTMSHRPEDFYGAKLGVDAKVFCGSEVRHCEGIDKGTLYDYIVEKNFAEIKHKSPEGTIITVQDTLKNNVEVAADMIRATSVESNIPTGELLKGARLYVDMGGSIIAKNLVDILNALGADVEVGNGEVALNYNTKHIIDPNELTSATVQLDKNKHLKEIAQQTGRVVVVIDPDGDRGSNVSIINKDRKVLAMTGSELLLLAMENMATSYRTQGKPTPTVICDMRTGLGADDLTKALNNRDIPVRVVPHEAGYPFFMRGMAALPADIAIENTTHAFTSPLTNRNWGAPVDYKGYQGGDNAALFLIYLFGCMVNKWEGRSPAEQLDWIIKTYNLKPTVVDERKPALPPEQDKYKYMIAERMKKLAGEWFTDNSKFLINFDNPNVKVVSGVHITNVKTRAMMLVRFSNTGASFTISGEAYTREELDEMLGLGHLIMTTAVEQLHREGHEFNFNIKDAANLEGKFNAAKYGLVLEGVRLRTQATLVSGQTMEVYEISPEEVSGYFNERIGAQGGTTRGDAAEKLREVTLVHDVERGGAFILEDQEEPEKIASVFGDTVLREDVPVIMDFMRRHLGDLISEKDAEKIYVVLEGSGIGGQRNVTGMSSRLVRLFPNREILLYSAFGAPFRDKAEEILQKLNEAHRDITTPEEKLGLLKQRKEIVKLLIRAASKSGTTPETMDGFQEQIQDAIWIFSQFVYGAEQGERFADTLIGKLYDGKNFLTGGAAIDKLDKDERMMLAIALDRTILATGKYMKRQQIVDGRARTGGSMFDRFSQVMAEKLGPEFEELGIEGISRVTLHNSFGGRTQALGPDAWINIAMALYDGRRDPIAALNEAVRPVAVRNSDIKDRAVFGKRLAALAMQIKAESMYIGLPTTIESRVIDALQQLIGESIDVGALVGYPTGMKAVVQQTTVLAQKSKYKQDGGKRLYLLVADELTDHATEEATEKILREQEKNGNKVVIVKIKDHSPEEVSRLYYEIINFVDWYGNFIAAEVLANLKGHKGIVDFMCQYAKEEGLDLTPDQIKNVNFEDEEASSGIIATLYSESQLDTSDPDYAYYFALRKVMKDLNVWFQPGVEWGKTAAQKQAEKLYVRNPDADVRIVADPVKAEESGVRVEDGMITGEVSDVVRGKIEQKIPVRDDELRRQLQEEQRAALEQANGAYIVNGEVHQAVDGRYGAAGIDIDGVPAISVTGKYNLTAVVAKIQEITSLREKQSSLSDTADSGGKYILEPRRKEHDRIEREIERLELDLIEIAGQVDCNGQTAQQLARVAFDAHKRGQGVALSLYAGRQRLEDLGLGDFLRLLDMLDMSQYATDVQHTDKDGNVAGTKNTFEILANLREPQGRRIRADGMVAPYWDDLTPQDMIFINHQAYVDVYNRRGVDYADLRLEGTSLEDIAKIYVLFAQANRIYRELNQEGVLRNQVKAELTNELSAQILRDLDSPDPARRDDAIKLARAYVERLDKIKGIILDIGGVLLVLDTEKREANFKKAFAELGLGEYTTEDALKELYRKFRTERDNDFRANRRGETDFDMYVRIFNGEYLHPTGIAVNLSPKQFALLFEYPFLVAPNSPEILSRLKERFSLKILSDQFTAGTGWSQADEVTGMVNEQYPGIFEPGDHIRSWEIRHTKDEPEAFDIALKRMGLEPEEVLFVDDRSDFTRVARDVRILTATIAPFDLQALGNNFILNELLTGEWRDKILNKLPNQIATQVLARREISQGARGKIDDGVLKAAEAIVLAKAQTESGLTVEDLDRVSPEVRDAMLLSGKAGRTNKPLASNEMVSLDRIIAISADNVIDREELFKEWLRKQPDNIEVVIIAANRDEYIAVEGLKDLPHLHIQVAYRPDIENLGLQDYQILKFDSRGEEISFFEELGLYARGINLGAKHKLDSNIVKAIRSGV